MQLFVALRRDWRLRGVLSATLAAGLLTAVVVAQQPLVLYITATDASGAPVTDLKAEEIAASEKGAPAKVVALEKAPRPIKLTIAVDNGQSSAPVMGYYREGLTALVKALPPDIEVSVVTMAPQPRAVLRSTANREEVLRGIGRFGPDDQPSRFIDMLVEYAQAIDKDAKDKKLTYMPYLLVVATSATPTTSIQRGEIEKSMGLIANSGARVSMAITTTKLGDSGELSDLSQGITGVVGGQLAKATRGRFEALSQPQRLQEVLPDIGKGINETHLRQTNQWKATIERPAGATNDLSGFNIGITRPDVKGAVSLDGRF